MVTPEPLPQLFIPLFTPNASLEQVGGKGLNLIKLARTGFPVTNAFLIPTECYWEFVNENLLDSFIQDALKSLDSTSPEALSAASAEIRTQFERGAISPKIASALEIAWRWLSAHPVAVRSSATAEDLPDMSFAGQQDTFLNIVGDEALREAVVKCWSSLWTTRAIGYRARNNISHQDVALCVIVQNMVPSDASGVMFTANPLTGCRTETAIDATLGLGEALVGGYVEPDHYVVATQGGGVHFRRRRAKRSAPHLLGPSKARITHKFQGSKSITITGKAEGGVITQEADRSSQQAIPDKIILQLAEMGQRVAELYNFPQDIEWAYILPPPSPPEARPEQSRRVGGRRGAGGDEGGLYLLQSRPITSLFPLPEGMGPEPLKFMIGFQAVQGVVDPFTPLGQDLMMLVLTGGGSAFKLEHTIETQTAFYIAAERIFINMTPILRTPQGNKVYPKVIKAIDPGVAQATAELVKDPRFAPIHHRPSLSTIRRFAGFMLPFVGQVIRVFRNPERRKAEIMQAFDDKVAVTKARQISSGDMWEDFSQSMQLLHEAKDLFPDFVIPKGIPPIVAGMAPFFGILERFSLEAAAATGIERFKTIFLEISRGMPDNVTTEMDLVLWGTAQTLRNDPDSSKAFDNTPAAALAASYLAGSLPPLAQKTIADFMDKFGARGLAEIDLGRKRWGEDPTHIMQVLLSYLAIDDPALAPDVVFERGAIAAQEAAVLLEQEVRKLPGGRIKARLVRFAANRYRAVGGMREAPKFFAIRMMGIIRQGLLESGQNFVDAGLLDQADDLFFLYIRELNEIVQQAQFPPDIRTRIAERRVLRKREMLRKQIPRVLLSDGTAFYEGVAAPDGDDNAIVGDPVSPGVVEGNVRVVLNPHETQLKPGEILVCPGTDPAWTPLFLAAGGLIMEVGGMMTHGSVVAREYGIPAVVGVHQATTRLETGQRIRMNGSTGQIEVISEQ
ncbi:MAG: hypothetical protein ISS57_08730 [Anaerolineales bacterium]|nr:hypothetical protein [Anaerolineales bacterium]